MQPKEPKEPTEPGAEVFSLEDARKKADAKADAKPDARADAKPDARADAKADGQTVTVDGGEFLKPVMAAIAKELAGVADPDGVVRVGGSDEASRAKTAAVVKGLGIGLGQALAEAFGKYAQKIETGQAAPPVTATVTTTTTPPTPEDDDKPS